MSIPDLSPPSDTSSPDILPVDIVPAASPPQPFGEYEAVSPPADLQTSQPAAGVQAPRDTAPLQRAMISCIMPTRGRPDFVEQAIAGFRAQDYPDRELIIVYDRDGDLPSGISGDDVRVIRAAENSIGGKRNQAAASARGEIIAQWDDDDWHAPGRLSLQAAPIVDGSADVTALNDILCFDAASDAFWEFDPALFARMFAENVAGGTLMFRKRDWECRAAIPGLRCARTAISSPCCCAEARACAASRGETTWSMSGTRRTPGGCHAART